MGLYEKHQRNRTQATVNEICEILCVELRRFRKVFVLVDALDEFNADDGQREPLISPLEKLLGEPPVRLMITSRYNVEVGFPDKARIDIRASDQDIRRYVYSRVSGNSSTTFRVKLDTKLQESVINQLAANAQGM